jgi:DNA-binding NarL/FixJ family response regulator
VSAEPTTVVIADDHAPTRAGVCGALTAEGFVIVAEGASARQAVELTALHSPEVCLLDIHMPGSGIAAAREISAAQPGVSVVMLTYSRDEADLFDALRAGAQGYLLKDMDPDRLGGGPARGAVRGGRPPRSLMARVLEEFRGGSGRRVVQTNKRPAQLSSREWEIMQLLRDGLSTDEVAKRLFISPARCGCTSRACLKKLQATDRAAALQMLGGQ